MASKLRLSEDELLKYDDLHGELQCSETNLMQILKMEKDILERKAAAIERKEAVLEKLKSATDRGYKPFYERMKDEQDRNHREKEKEKEKEKRKKEKIKKGGE